MIPVLFIGFRRPEETRKVISNLVAQKIGTLYVAMDGPRNQEEVNLTNQARRACKESIPTNTDARYLFSEKNLGIEYFPPAAIDWFFTHEKYGLIIEDDVVIHRDFIAFASHYLKNEKALVVSASLFSEGQFDQPDMKPFKTPIISVWGWGTTSSIWLAYRQSELDFRSPLRVIRQLIRTLTVPQALVFAMCLYYISIGRLATWDYQFAYYLLINRIYTIYPPVNMAVNIGNSAGAMNCTDGEDLSLPVSDERIAFQYPDVNNICFNKRYSSSQALNSRLMKIHIWYAVKGLIKYAIVSAGSNLGIRQ